MSLKAPVEAPKGRSGERVFAVALFLTLVVAALVAWFVVGQNVEDAEKAFLGAHERYMLAAEDAVARLLADFDALPAQYDASSPARLTLSSASDSIRSISRSLGVFDSNGRSVLADQASVYAPQNPAIRSARYSPYRHDLLFSRSPFTGERAILFTSAFEDASNETLVLAMEAESALFADNLFTEDPERKDILLLVTHDGSVIGANERGAGIVNLIKWAESAAAKEEEPQPLYVAIRDRIAGFATYEGDQGALRLAHSPVSGTDWMLCQIEFVE